MTSDQFEQAEVAPVSVPVSLPVTVPLGFPRSILPAIRPWQDRAIAIVERTAAPALRISLGVVFVWFGALKLAGHSPVAGLIRATLPWFDPDLVVPALGAVEVAIGLGLLLSRLSRFRRLTLAVLCAHLTGTFLTFLDAPQMMIHRHNPLLLTGNGEFVLKNMVLICAALVLLAASGPARGTPPA
jgi:putative oxidoreductase